MNVEMDAELSVLELEMMRKNSLKRKRRQTLIEEHSMPHYIRNKHLRKLMKTVEDNTILDKISAFTPDPSKMEELKVFEAMIKVLKMRDRNP